MLGNEPCISIIVPVYNVEKYLEKCVDSILSQTFGDFELILVDDESPDNCGRLCDGYAEKDPRVQVIHKKNGGLSDARNAGIKAARAGYIGFIDSDDYAESELLKILYTLITDADADISACGIMNCYSDHKTPQYDKKETFIADNKQAYRLMLEGKKIPGSSCGKLYKREIFDEFLFLKNKKYEDAFLFSDIMPVIKKVAVSTKPLYNYVHREGSYTTTFKEKEFDVIEAYTKNLNTIRSCFPDLLQQGLFRYYWAHFIVLDHMLAMPDYRSLSGYKDIVTLLKKSSFQIFRNRYFNKTRRISSLFLFINVRLYRLLLLQNNRKNAKLHSSP